jgi:hypothetical protein
MWEKSEGQVGTLHHMGQAEWAEMVAWGCSTTIRTSK